MAYIDNVNLELYETSPMNTLEYRTLDKIIQSLKMIREGVICDSFRNDRTSVPHSFYIKQEYIFPRLSIYFMLKASHFRFLFLSLIVLP